MGAVNTLQLTSKEEITFANFKSVQFIDCGNGLAHIFCQWCGHELEMRCWQEIMSNAYDGNAFNCLRFRTPCCKLSSSLEELVYVKPCGFATFVIEVFNPKVIPCAVELHEMNKCFGKINFFKMISAHI